MDTAATAELLAPARPRRLTLTERAIDIALLDWGGDGPLVLLHHANGFCKGVWGLVAALLHPHFRVVAMDARGHGDSSKPSDPGAYAWHHFADDLIAIAGTLAEEHGSGSVALGIGHSFGGTSMMTAAAQRPDLFDKLLLVDPVTPPPPAASPPPGRPDYIRRLVEGARERRAIWPSRAEARSHLGERSLFAACDPRALDLYVWDGLRERDDGSVELKCAGATEAAIFGGSANVDVFAVARQVATPTLFQWAAHGDFPRRVYETLAASMPHGHVETVDTGHLVPLERPDRVATAAQQIAGP